MIDRIRTLNKEKKMNTFLIMWGCFFVVLFFRGYDATVNKINATMLAFSYDYGFISRGFIGSVYQLLDKILPWDMMNYDGVLGFTHGITLVYYLILIVFCMTCFIKCSQKVSDTMKYAIIMFCIWAVPMFVSQYNFGRLDVYCVMLSLFAAILLMIERAECLVIVFSAIGVMIHQGNVFMFLNIILVLLLYKAFSNTGKNRIKYLVLFAASFLVASGLFLYFEFFSHFNGENILEDILAKATVLCKDGEYHQDVIDHEILGIDLSEREWVFRLQNFVQFPIFIILMLPHIIIVTKMFAGMIKKASSTLDKWKYFLVSIGAATIIPDLLLKCDYGRWMFAIICYYCVVLLALLGMKDKIVEQTLLETVERLKRKYPTAILLLAYPVLFQPLWDVAICNLVAKIAGNINTTFLHWW